MWQEVREELHRQGLEIVTVAMDTGGVEDSAKWIDDANAAHPSLIDERHRLGDLFGVVNVPSGIWIDERGMIVRGPEPAWPGRSVFRELMAGFEPGEDADPAVVRALEVTKGIKVDPKRTLEMLRDWVVNGDASPYALTPEEVLARSRPRPPAHSEAAARFELGQHLWRAGDRQGAIEHFKRAHELQPDNWTYKRQAWQFVSPVLQDAREVYGTDWASEVEAAGPENYYPSPA